MNVTSGPIQEEMDGLEEESYASGWESRYSEIIRLMAVCFSLISTIWLVLVALADRTSGASAHPRVSISNGSYHGLHNQKLKQDMFLGMPYAKPPTGDLRFRRPQSLAESWDDHRDATEYGSHCFGYGVCTPS